MALLLCSSEERRAFNLPSIISVRHWGIADLGRADVVSLRFSALSDLGWATGPDILTLLHNNANANAATLNQIQDRFRRALCQLLVLGFTALPDRQTDIDFPGQVRPQFGRRAANPCSIYIVKRVAPSLLR